MESLRHGFEEPGDEQDIRLVVDTIPTLAWSAGPDGSADFVNQRWLDYTGLSAKQALGSGWQVAIQTTLGFADRKPTNSGTVLILSRATRELAHAIQRMHKIEIHIAPDAASSCNLCKASKPDPAAGEKASPQK